jgi:hypothetical protein
MMSRRLTFVGDPERNFARVLLGILTRTRLSRGAIVKIKAFIRAALDTLLILLNPCTTKSMEINFLKVPR